MSELLSTEEKILAAARAEFLEKGYNGARMEAIARRADINKALTLDDKHILSYFFRAGLFANKLEVDKAIDDFNKIIRLEPNNGKAYDHRGYAKIQMGDKSGGCDDFKKARELGFMVGNKEGDKFICK